MAQIDFQLQSKQKAYVRTNSISNSTMTPKSTVSAPVDTQNLESRSRIPRLHKKSIQAQPSKAGASEESTGVCHQKGSISQRRVRNRSQKSAIGVPILSGKDSKPHSAQSVQIANTETAIEKEPFRNMNVYNPELSLGQREDDFIARRDISRGGHTRAKPSTPTKKAMNKIDELKKRIIEIGILILFFFFFLF